jgi:hypothetical protein
VSWTPQPGPQTVFVDSAAFEVVYGGARGGGKTDAALGDFLRHAQAYGAAARGLLVRRQRVALEPTIARARQIFGPEGAVWRQARSRFEWSSGAVLYFRYLNNDADADLYQGHDYSRFYVEELTQFPSPGPVDKLKATLRSAAGAPTGFRATCNPGGPGHNWVKARYIDPGPFVTVEEAVKSPFDGRVSVMTRTFIPARLADNPKLLANDPDYVARLQQAGPAALVRAWLEGDWNVIEGAFFDKWSMRNIVRPFAVPADWTRLRAFDWGYAAPFSVGWWAVAGEGMRLAGGEGGSLVLPRGALVRYREWYGCTGRPGEGIRLEAEAVARGILEREAGERIDHALADPSIFSHNGGPSIAERLRKSGVTFRAADNTRVGKAGALSGWDQMRARIAGDEEGPMLVVFDTCREFIRTVPVLQHDPMRAEDLDTNAEDHIADETRYACLARPIASRPAPSPPARSSWEQDFGRGQAGRSAAGWKVV